MSVRPYTSATRFIDINSTHCSSSFMSTLLQLGDYIRDSIGLTSAATGNTYTGRIINQSMTVYSDSNLGAVANAMVVFSGPGQLEEPLSIPQLKKYLVRHGNRQELGPQFSKGGKQKRVISALAAVVDLLRKEGQSELPWFSELNSRN